MVRTHFCSPGLYSVGIILPVGVNMSFSFSADGVCVCFAWRVKGGLWAFTQWALRRWMQINQALCSDVWDMTVKPQSLSLFNPVLLYMDEPLKNLSAVVLHNLLYT